MQVTTHFNWDWVVKEALPISFITLKDSKYSIHIAWDQQNASPADNDSTHIGIVPFRELLSVQRHKINQPDSRVKPSFALFRVELHGSDLSTNSSVWADSQAFSFLDAKDSLYVHLNQVNIANVMPATIMIPWNISSVADLTKLLIGHNVQGNERTTGHHIFY